MTGKLYRIAVALCWVAGAVLVVLTTRLARQNRALVSQIDNFVRSLSLPIGARVPPIIGLDRNGSSVALDSRVDEAAALVLVFSPSCPACDENWPNWYSLVSRQRAIGGPVVTIDLSGMVNDEYLLQHAIDSMPVLTLASLAPETMLAYQFRFTPQTIILRRGEVIAGWTGVLTEADVATALQALAGDAGSVAEDSEADKSAAPRDSTSGAGDTSAMTASPRPGARNAPFCDGLSCARSGDCGTLCTCKDLGPDKPGLCVAKAGARRAGTVR